MPYTAEHKAKTRAKIVDAARGLFNRYGFEQVTIDQVMNEAKLTRGGFYNHFKSKDELFAETVASYQTCNPLASKLAASSRRPPNAHRLACMLVELYLSDEVLSNPDKQCPLYALPSDVSRAGPRSKVAYTDLIRGMTSIYRAAMEGMPDAKERADVIVSLCVGGMVLARTTNDATLRATLRASSKRQALSLLGVA